MPRKSIDPFDGPSWLAPHRHPEVFSRKIAGVHFRLPGWKTWTLWAALFIASLMVAAYGWTWVVVFPLVLTLGMVGWSGMLTNFGKPIQSAVAIGITMVGLNIAIMVMGLVTIMAMQTLGWTPTAEEPNSSTTTSQQPTSTSPNSPTR